MKLSRVISIVLLMACAFPFAEAHAQRAGEVEVILKPVMIIRFNQPHVYFQKPLASVIHQAKQKKHDVVFDVIQYIPATNSNTQTDSNLQSVIEAINANGIGEDRVHVSIQPSEAVSSDEVYIYVR